jgi:hypothetical protein
VIESFQKFKKAFFEIFSDILPIFTLDAQKNRKKCQMLFCSGASCELNHVIGGKYFSSVCPNATRASALKIKYL